MRYEYTAEFELFWEKYPKRDRPDLKKAAFRCWKTRLGEGVTAELLTACAEEYATDLRRKGKYGTEFVLMAKTFLGPDERWIMYKPQPKPAPASKRAAAPAEPIPAEERANPAEAKAFIAELLIGLARATKSPTCS